MKSTRARSVRSVEAKSQRGNVGNPALISSVMLELVRVTGNPGLTDFGVFFCLRDHDKTKTSWEIIMTVFTLEVLPLPNDTVLGLQVIFRLKHKKHSDICTLH
jgi:hypothetical protein